MNIELENAKIRSELEVTKKELKAAHNGYQYAQAEDEIDYYIYQIKASQSKFMYLLNKIKKLEQLSNT